MAVGRTHQVGPAAPCSTRAVSLALVGCALVGCRGRSGDPHAIEAPELDPTWSHSVMAPPALAARALRFAPCARPDETTSREVVAGKDVPRATGRGHELVAGAEAAVWREADRVSGAYTLEAEVELRRGMVGLMLGARDPAGLADRRPVDRDEARAHGRDLGDLERERAVRIEDDGWMVFAVRVDRSHRIWVIEGDEERVLRSPRAITPEALHTTTLATARSHVHLEVEVGAMATVFRVDGNEVARASRGALPTDGSFGWWVAPDTEGWVSPMRLRRGMR